MQYFPIFLIAISLAVDSFSAAIAGGIKEKKATLAHGLTVGFVFGSMQAAMAAIGWLLGVSVMTYLVSFIHIIAFLLLTFIGIRMIHESLNETKSDNVRLLNTSTLLLLGFATSIDAFIVGITLPVINVPITVSLFLIGAVTFLLSFAGYLLGNRVSSFLSVRIELFGGLLLIGLGIKILLERFL